MNDETKHKHRKYWIFAVLALLVAFIAYALADEALNQQIAFEIVKNNTDLCNFNHTSLLCDGTRQSNVTYYTNDTPIVLYVFAHASAAGGVAGVFLYRDGVLIEAQSGRPLASPEQTWRGITAIIPRNSSYKVNFTNYHHFEWYEDQILSGKNGTLSYNTYINQTGGGCTGNCAFNNLTVNSLGKNNTMDTYTDYIHLTSPFKDIINNTESFIDLRNNNTYLGVTNNSNGNTSDILISPDYAAMSVSNGFLNSIEINMDKIRLFSNSISMTFNGSYLDMGGSTAINGSFPSDNTKVNKTGDNMTGQIDFGRKMLTNVSEINFFSADYNYSLLGRYSAISYPYQQVGTTPASFNYYFRTVSRVWDTSTNAFVNGSNPELMGSYDSLGNGNYQVGSFPANSTTKHLDFDVSASSAMVTVRTPLNLTISALAGVGNAYVCVDSTGKLYRGNPTC